MGCSFPSAAARASPGSLRTRPAPGRRDHAVVVTSRQVDPGAHLVGSGDDLAAVVLGAERQRRLAGRFRGVPVAGVVLRTPHQQGHPSGRDQDFAVLFEGDALTLERGDPAQPGPAFGHELVGGHGYSEHSRPAMMRRPSSVAWSRSERCRAGTGAADSSHRCRAAVSGRPGRLGDDGNTPGPPARTPSPPGSREGSRPSPVATGQPAQRPVTSPARSPVAGDCHTGSWGGAHRFPRVTRCPGADWLPNVRLSSRWVTFDSAFPVILL